MGMTSILTNSPISSRLKLLMPSDSKMTRERANQVKHQHACSSTSMAAHLSSWMTRSKKKRSEGKRLMAIAFKGESLSKGSTLCQMPRSQLHRQWQHLEVHRMTFHSQPTRTIPSNATISGQCNVPAAAGQSGPDVLQRVP